MGARGSRDDMAVEEMGGGDPPPSANKRRQRASSERPELTITGGGGGGGPPPPPPGPHATLVPDLLPTHTAIVQGMQEMFRQNHELRQATLFMEQQRQANEARRSMEEAEHRERMAAMLQYGFGRTAAAAESAAASAQRANEMSQSAAQQFVLALQDAKRQERPPTVNVVVNGGQPPPPPPPPSTAPLEAVPAQPPNRAELVPVVQIKRAASESEQVMAKRRPADELARKEPRALSRLAIAAASGAASGPEHPDEVPASSSAGPEYKRPEQVAPYAAANGALASKAAARIAAAFPGVDARRIVDQVARGEVDAGTALANLYLDQSGSRPTMSMRDAAARASSVDGRFFSGKAYRLTSNPPARRPRDKMPVPPTRGRSRSNVRVNNRDI